MPYPVNVYDAFAGGSAYFALAYVALRVVLVGLYAWAWYHVRDARPLSRRYVAGFSLGAVVWGCSLLVPEPHRFWLWCIGLLVELATPIVAQWQVLRAAPIQRSHLPERFGLFTLLVLGESIVVTGAGVAGTAWNLRSVLVATSSFATVGCLWWLYFDHVDEAAFARASAGGVRACVDGFVWAYGHLLTFVGLTVLAVGIEQAIGEASEPVLALSTRAALSGGVALYVCTLIILHTRRPSRLSQPVLLARLGVSLGTLVLTFIGGMLAPFAFAGTLTISVVGLLVFESTRAPHGVTTPGNVPTNS